MVIDVENLFMCVHKEEDADTKQVYFYLFKLLRKGILQMSNVTVEGPLGTPPFEKPSIGKVWMFFFLLNYKQLLDEVFVISGIIKVEVSVISRSRRLRLITLTETLIIPDITKTESNNCFIIHCFEENNDKRIIAAITVYF